MIIKINNNVFYQLRNTKIFVLMILINKRPLFNYILSIFSINTFVENERLFTCKTTMSVKMEVE